jgi:hypothetical protein
MMNRFILVLSLLFGLNSGFAQVPIDSNANYPIGTQQTNSFIDDDLLGQKGVEFFNALAKQSQLYSFLLSLDSGVPAIARQLKYVALLNEAHLTNQLLSHMLSTLNHNNQLLHHFISKGESMDG